MIIKFDVGLSSQCIKGSVKKVNVFYYNNKIINNNCNNKIIK